MRSGRAKKRVTETDLIHKSKVVSRMTNVLMLKGKKSLARKVLYGAIGRLAEDRREGLQMFEQAVKNVMPVQEVRSRRVGGATYQVPMPVKHERSEALALRWIVGAARSKKGKPMEEKLFEEIKNAQEGTGNAVRKRDETHKMAEA